MPTSSRSKSQNNYNSNDHAYDKKIGEKTKTDVFPMQTKRRREMIHGFSDRWNADDGENESEIANIVESNDFLTAIGDSKSNISRKYNEWRINEEMSKIELQKDLEKRMKIREAYKYSENDNKHKGETNNKREDEYRKDSNRDYRVKEDRYQDDVEQEHKRKTGRARDDIDGTKRSREHISESESKNLEDGRHLHTNNLGGSPIYDDHVARHKDDKDARKDNNNSNNINKKDEIRDYRFCNVQDRHLESNWHMNSAKIDPSRVHHRVSKQEETKNRDGVHQDLSDKVYVDDLSPKKRLKSGSQIPPSSTNKFYEDDRGKLNNWRQAAPNSGQTQTNWNNFQNWPYTPFHHFPPPMFNPFMYQSMPPIVGSLPVNMNHATMPYNFIGDIYGNWDHFRTELNYQSWESNVVGVDLQSAVQQNEDPVHGHEENNLDFNIPEVMKVAETPHGSMIKNDDDAYISQAYLSKIDISKDLTRPEVYDQCTSMLVGLDKASSVLDECDCKILFSEDGIEDDISNCASLFPAADDSVYKKAMSLYTKQKVRYTATGLRSAENR